MRPPISCRSSKQPKLYTDKYTAGMENKRYSKPFDHDDNPLVQMWKNTFPQGRAAKTRLFLMRKLPKLAYFSCLIACARSRRSRLSSRSMTINMPNSKLKTIVIITKTVTIMNLGDIPQMLLFLRIVSTCDCILRNSVRHVIVRTPSMMEKRIGAIAAMRPTLPTSLDFLHCRLLYLVGWHFIILISRMIVTANMKHDRTDTVVA